MKKMIKIILMACFLCQSPVLCVSGPIEQDNQFFDDNSGWKLFGGVVLAGLAVWAVSYVTKYFAGSGQTPGRSFKVTELPNNFEELYIPKKMMEKMLSNYPKQAFIKREKPIWFNKPTEPEKPTDTTPGEKPVGFKNTGIDCYLNALLTTFVYTSTFANFLLTHKREINDLCFQKGLDCFEGEDKASLSRYVRNISGVEGKNDTQKKDVETWDDFRAWLIVSRVSAKKNKEKDKEIFFTHLLKKVLLVDLLDLANQVHLKKVLVPLIQKRVKESVCALTGLETDKMQDPSEAVNAIFDAFELIKDSGETAPALHKFLGFDHCTYFKCLGCDKEWQDNPDIHTHICLQQLVLPQSKSPVTLKTLLNNADFYTANNLPVNDTSKWLLALHCAKQQNVFRIQFNKWKKVLGRSPKLLFFQFPRGGIEGTEKNATPVTIPLVFCAREYLLDNSDKLEKYGLHAIILHKGQSSSSGHYISYVKSCDKWYEYDDAKVTEITLSTLDNIINPKTELANTPAMILYQKV